MNQKIARLWKFLTDDIWRITEDEVNKTTFSVYTVIKTIYLCVNRFTKDRLANKAAALTYSTLFALIPILAVVFAIARGFGFDNVIEHEIATGFGGLNETSSAILNIVNTYLSQTKNGIFIGVGLIMLLWSVLNLINNMEITFNRIWQVQKARSVYRRITDYFSMLLLIPILLVLSGGLSIFMSTMLKNMEDFTLLAPLGKFLVRLIPSLASDLVDHLPLWRPADLCRAEHQQLQLRQGYAQHQPTLPRLRGRADDVAHRQALCPRRKALYGRRDFGGMSDPHPPDPTHL